MNPLLLIVLAFGAGVVILGLGALVLDILTPHWGTGTGNPGENPW